MSASRHIRARRRAAAPRSSPASQAIAASRAGSKSELTRTRLYDAALALFRERGVEATTMREIAAATKMSLGAAYYYFPSKEALLLAYYRAGQDAADHAFATHRTTLGDAPLRARLSALLHGKLDTLGADRGMLAALVPRLVNPTDPVSALSGETAEVRERSIATFATALEGEPLSPEARDLLARALWLGHMALLLYWAHDDSPGQQRTRRLIEDALDLGLPLVALAGTPFAAPIVGQLRGLLTRAGLLAEPPPARPTAPPKPAALPPAPRAARQGRKATATTSVTSKRMKRSM